MFIQIHTLTSYPATLLNRDQDGLAKRIDIGGVTRIRVSSQCLKHAWREALLAHDEGRLPGGIRSTHLFELRVLPAVLEKNPELTEDVARAGLRALLEVAVKGGGDEKDKRSLVTKQPILLGAREVDFLAEQAAQWLKGQTDPKTAAEHVQSCLKDVKAERVLPTMLGLSEPLAAGVESALFGRFVTSDLIERTDGAVSVSNAYTVHAAAQEIDFFSVVDDLVDHAGHIGDSELGSGLFYGYAVVDVAQLVANVTGVAPKRWKQADTTASQELVSLFVETLARKSPGAKKGATAPFSAAEFVLLEAGTAQPRTLGNAFQRPVDLKGDPMGKSIQALAEYIGAIDGMYGVQEKRSFASVRPAEVPNAARAGSLRAAVQDILTVAFA